MKVGARIEEVAHQKRLTQEGIARACRIHATSLNRIIRGHVNPSWEVLERIITKGLGMTVEEFFCGAQQDSFGSTIDRALQRAIKDGKKDAVQTVVQAVRLILSALD